MVDLHCHILPGIDDGAKTVEESLAMAESAIADGITHVVATPHANTEYSFDFARVRAARDELQDRVGDRLQIATGCDFHLNPENVEALNTSRDRVRSPFSLLLILSRRNSGEGWRKRFSSTTLWRRSKAGTCRLSRKWPTSGRRNPANAFSFFREFVRERRASASLWRPVSRGIRCRSRAPLPWPNLLQEPSQ